MYEQRQVIFWPSSDHSNLIFSLIDRILNLYFQLKKKFENIHIPEYDSKVKSTMQAGDKSMVSEKTITEMHEKQILLKEPTLKADMDAVEHMIRQCAERGEGFAIDEFKPDGHYLHRLLYEPRVLLVVDNNQRILGASIYGYSNLSRVPGSIFGAYFIVEKEHRRRGIGTLLLKAVCDISTEMQCDTLVFDVFINNHGAITWLNKAGFHCTGSLRHCGYMKGQGFTDCLLLHRKCQPNAIDDVVSRL